MNKPRRPTVSGRPFAAWPRAGVWLAAVALMAQSLIPLAQGLPTIGAGGRPMLICKAMQAGTVPGKGPADERRSGGAACPVCTSAAFAAASLHPPETVLAAPGTAYGMFAAAEASSPPSGRVPVANGARAPPAAV